MNKFTSIGSFFMNVTGSMAINEEHYIGVTTSGNKDKVMIKSLRCSLEVVEPSDYGFNKEPLLRFNWSVEYVNWNRSKGTWGVRSQYQNIDDEFLNNKIITSYTRGSLEQQLVTRLQNKLQNGLTAIDNNMKELLAK